MKSTGPSPVITIAMQPGCLLVKFHGIQVAASSRARVLLEANYPPVYYVPWEDIDEQYFARTDHTTYCPYKGDATYYSLQIPGMRAPTRCGAMKTPKCRSIRFAGMWRSIPIRLRLRCSKTLSEVRH
ncbi:DUF427 domain-containing protein [Pseudomonas mandelii]